MSKPNKVKVWEWSTGKQAHFHDTYWWDKTDLVDAELVQGCRWLADVLNGLRKNHDNIEVTINHKIVLFEDSETFERWMGVSPNLNEALLAACLKYMEAK